MSRQRLTFAEEWDLLGLRLREAGLAILHALGLHTRRELEQKDRQAKSWAREASAQATQKREAERLLVLLSEPLKDWDLADFPEPSYLRQRADVADRVGTCIVNLDYEDARHLANVLDAYRLTASAVAPLRMGRVVDDKAKRRGWDDQPIQPATIRATRDPKRLP